MESVLDFIPGRQEEKSAQYRKTARVLEKIPGQLPPETPVNPEKIKKGLLHLRTSLEDLEEKLFVAGAAQEIALVGENMDAVDSVIEQLRQYPERIGPPSNPGGVIAAGYGHIPQPIKKNG